MKRTVKGKGGREKAASPGDYAADVDRLYQLPLAEFTSARNALAARIKKAGEDASAVRTLPKPSISAWTVNQLFWRHRAEFDKLMIAGERFRDAQAAQLEGKAADLRAPLEARREALSALSRLAAALLHDAGNPASPDMMRRVTTTLEALAVYGRHAGAPPAGRLHDDVDPPGFEALSALVPRVGTGKTEGPSRVLTFRPEPPRTPKPKLDPETAARQAAQERKAAVAAAREAVHAAERGLREARREMQTAEAALKKVAARARQTEQEKADAEARLEQATAAAESARQEARRVAADAETAAQTVEDAERALERARKTLQEVGD